MKLVRERAHLKRWAIFRCRWFRIYLHEILGPDPDEHPHTHPWHFFSLMLSGSYIESSKIYGAIKRTPANLIWRNKEVAHRISEVITPAKTLVLAIGKHDDNWGYDVGDVRIKHSDYRRLKSSFMQ